MLRHRTRRHHARGVLRVGTRRGSDVSSLKTRAVYDEAKDEWVLNGTKAWATNGGIADTHVVTATVDPHLGFRESQASFIVPKGTPGISQGQKYKKHGIRASHTAEVVLDDCRVPAACSSAARRSSTASWPRRVRELKTGEKQPAMATFEATRPSGGDGRRQSPAPAYEDGAHLRERARRLSASPSIQNQAIAFMLADMITEIDAARLLVHRAAWLARNGGYTNAEGSQCKLRRDAVAVWVTERAIQIHGATATPVSTRSSACHRDAKIYDIFEGTEQIQQLVISRAISGLRIE